MDIVVKPGANIEEWDALQIAAGDFHLLDPGHPRYKALEVDQQSSRHRDSTLTNVTSPRRMLQPSKDDLRRQLEVAEARVAYLSAPWWVRARGRIKAAWL